MVNECMRWNFVGGYIDIMYAYMLIYGLAMHRFYHELLCGPSSGHLIMWSIWGISSFYGNPHIKMVSFKMICPHTIWLVVEPHPWKIWKSIGMMTFPIYGIMIQMFQSPPTSLWFHKVSWLKSCTHRGSPSDGQLPTFGSSETRSQETSHSRILTCGNGCYTLGTWTWLSRNRGFSHYNHSTWWCSIIQFVTVFPFRLSHLFLATKIHQK